jgi:hypothetical protein
MGHLAKLAASWAGVLPEAAGPALGVGAQAKFAFERHAGAQGSGGPPPQTIANLPASAPW